MNAFRIGGLFVSSSQIAPTVPIFTCTSRVTLAVIAYAVFQGQALVFDDGHSGLGPYILVDRYVRKIFIQNGRTELST